MWNFETGLTESKVEAIDKMFEVIEHMGDVPMKVHLRRANELLHASHEYTLVAEVDDKRYRLNIVDDGWVNKLSAFAAQVRARK